MPELLGQHGCYHCPKCLQPVVFDPVPHGQPGWGSGGALEPQTATAVCHCTSSTCERRDVRLRVKLFKVDAEEIPQEEVARYV